VIRNPLFDLENRRAEVATPSDKIYFSALAFSDWRALNWMITGPQVPFRKSVYSQTTARPINAALPNRVQGPLGLFQYVSG
jgi:hypothetical protein